MNTPGNYPILILCGGQGARMRPLTENMPKPLIEIGGRPILSYIIDHLVSEGMRQLVFCVGYKAEKVVHFATRYCRERSVQYDVSDSGEFADIAERLRRGSERFPDGVFFCYGDTIADVSLSHVLQTSQSKDAVAVLSVIPLKSSFGVFTDGEDGAITSYIEKPTLPYWINIGYGFLGARALEILQDTCSMEQFLSTLKATGKLFMYRHSGKHITFNTLSEREEAEDAIRTL